MNDTYGALTIGGLTDDEIDAFMKAAGRVEAGEDARDFVEADREEGTVSFGGDLYILHEALEAMVSEKYGHESDVCEFAARRLAEEYQKTFGESLT